MHGNKILWNDHEAWYKWDASESYRQFYENEMDAIKWMQIIEIHMNDLRWEKI